VRVSTVFNRALALEGTLVQSVSFTDRGIILSVTRRGRLYRCPCGWATRARYDVSRRRWRHLDLFAQQTWLEADIARIDCHACEQIRTEDVPWARPGARCTRQVEDKIAWLAQRMDKSAIAALMRCAWRTVDAVVRRVVNEHLTADGEFDRLNGLRRIGVDEISYKRGHKYLTVIADHDTGRVVWISLNRTQAAFEEFTTALGPQRCAQISAITMDMSPIYRPVAARTLPNARICFDPFHLIKWANEALDLVFQRVYRDVHDRLLFASQYSLANWRTARFLLRSGAENLSPDQDKLLERLRLEDLELSRAWELKEGLRDLYRNANADRRAGREPDPTTIRTYLTQWCQAAADSKINAFRNLAKRVRNHFEGILAAVELGLSNSRLEGVNSKIRVIQRRGYGHQHPDTLAAMIHLCLGGITLKLPT
jgi:transposase